MLKKIGSVLLVLIMLFGMKIPYITGYAAAGDTIWVEGESLSGYAVDETIPALSGGQFAKVERSELPLASISMTVTVPETGRYAMECVANECVGNWTNPFNFVINGSEINANDIKFGGAANSMFATYKAEIGLQKGTNTIALNATDRRTAYEGNLSMIYLDYISFAYIQPIDIGNPIVKIEGEDVPDNTTGTYELCSGGQYGSSAGNEMEMGIYIPVGGTYNMRVVTSAKLPSAALNGADAGAMTAIKRAGNFTAYEMRVSLETGKNNLKITTPDSVMTLDYIAFYEAGAKPTVISVEGESLTGYHEQSNDQLSGGKYISIDSNVQPFVSISVPVQVPKAGKYRMECVALEHEGDWTNPFDFVINDTTTLSAQSIKAGQVKHNEFALYAAEVTLNEGENTLKLAVTGERRAWSGQNLSLMYLDYVKFVSVEMPEEKENAEYIRVNAKDMGYATITDSSSGITFAKAVASTKEGAAIDVSFYAARAGSYLMRFDSLVTYANSDEDRFSICLNNALWDAYANQKEGFFGDVNGDGDTYARYEAYVNLKSGLNQLSLKAIAPKEDSAQYRVYVDDIHFEPIDPTVVIEAESLSGYENELDTTNEHSCYAKATGTEGAEIIASFYAPASGNYQMEFSGSKQNDSGNAYEVSINDMVIAFETKDKAQPTVWAVETAVYTGTAILQKGVNTVKFTAKTPQNETYAMYLDYVKFSPVFTTNEISVQPEQSAIRVGEHVNIFAVDGAGNKIGADNIEYISSNENVATVSRTGMVTGIGTGTCEIQLKIKLAGEEVRSLRASVTVAGSDLIFEPEISGNKLVIPYVVLTTQAPAENATIVVRRTNGGVFCSAAVQNIQLSEATNLYRSVEIPLESTEGDITVFVFDSLGTLRPLCEKISVQK